MQLTKFGGVPLPTIDEDLTVPFETYSNIVALPYGSFDEHGQGSVLAPYVLTRTFKIACGENDHPLNTQLDTLMRAFASGRKVLEANWRDGVRRQTFAKVINGVRPRRSNDKKYQELTVTFRIDYPYWFDSADEPHYLDHELLLDSGLFLDGQYAFSTIDVTTPSPFLTITTESTMQIRRGTLILTPVVAGSITDITLTNLANQMVLHINGNLPYGSQIVIDFLSRSCKKDTLNFYSAIEIPSGQMDWMVLELGENIIQSEALALDGRTEVEWHWADTFI